VINRAKAAADSGNLSIVIETFQSLSLEQLENNHELVNLALQVIVQGDFEQQWEIAKIIPKLGEIAIQPLLEILNDPEIELENRWAVARISGGFSQPQVIIALVKLIQQNEDVELTAIAIGALTKIGVPAIAALTDLLGTVDRTMAISTLAQIRHSQTIEPLITAIDDPDPQIRAVIIEALGSFHDRRIPPLLLTKLTDPAAIVRTAAVTALCFRSDLAAELNLLGHLRPRLFDLSLTVCQATALGLSRLPDPAVVKIFAEILSSPHTPDQLKFSIILGLGWIGTPAAIDSLIIALASTSIDLAPAIITSISKTAQAQVYASQMLVDYLQSSSQHLSIVKQEIAAALGNLGNPQTVTALIQLLGDSDDRVKLYTIAAITKLSPIVAPEVMHLENQENLLTELQSGI
jgi:HEAT repeat protein